RARPRLRARARRARAPRARARRARVPLGIRLPKSGTEGRRRGMELDGSRLRSTWSQTRVFLTGASSGIGRGLALQLARPGGRIGLVARRQPELEELAAELDRRGCRALVLPVDVRDTD